MKFVLCEWRESLASSTERSQAERDW